MSAEAKEEATLDSITKPHPNKETTKVKPAPEDATRSFQDTAQQFRDQALQFLSTASNETLGACLVGLGATTYLVLGRVGLVLMGVVGGVVLHATWDGNTTRLGSQAAEEKRRREIGLDVIHRVLSWRVSEPQTADGEDGTRESVNRVDIVGKKRLDFSSFRPETANALNELSEAFTRDYIRWWYDPIIPDEQSFPEASQQMLIAFLVSLSNNLSRKRPADTFLNFLTNSSSILIVFLNELSAAIAASPGLTSTKAIQTYLDANPGSNLANVLDTKHQERKLDLVAQDILECYLDTKAFNCEPVRVFMRQILAKVVMEKIIQSCSKPEFINGWIVYLLEDGEPDLLKDIDASLQGVEESKPEETLAVAEKTISTISPSDSTESTKHKRTISKAQEAMDEAMREAQRLTQLMIEDDARREKERQKAERANSSPEAKLEVSRDAEIHSTHLFTDDASESTTQGNATPTSSQSDAPAEYVDTATKSNTLVTDESFDSSTANKRESFTSFDQLPSHQQGSSLSDELEERKSFAPLTLHNANISIFDDTDPSDRATLRQKPMTDYLIQIEPASSQYPGWMIVRKYSDFETLHEVLRRIAAISGASVFVQAHTTLPNFKAHTKATLREALERYLSDAMSFPSLAESEGMKRFLEKERGMDKSPNTRPGFGWPTPGTFEKVGKGMMDVLTQAPKDVAGGGKALIGGVTGVLGAKKRNASVASLPLKSGTSNQQLPPRMENVSQQALPRQSTEGTRGVSPIVDTQPAPHPQMERKPSTPVESPVKSRSKPTSRSSSRPASTRGSTDAMPVLGGDQILSLPPRPSEIQEDYDVVAHVESPAIKPELPPRKSASTTRASTEITSDPPATKRSMPAKPPLTEQETQMVVELVFAIITELYQLSSAWTLRKTLLTAAKTFLLRPGNPQLESIRQLIQTTIIDANTSDEGVAAHIRKIRENALPTEVELKAWPSEPSEEEKENLKKKARKLLVERGMPQALTSVMGQAASGEALGKVFDCLQMSNVARGLVFGLMLQGMRVVTQ
ncbi:uncharacterized protein PV09_03351 [Verruconis gallopava]|uniref:PXA domain-containing protein n=1 Tax=Verruconis gallopava TaxID=253628 RepID=A0A0D1YXN3_9PEZI|nr:uncharacterized protein PV09_03351 [Verruconis gallopava]KIW05462.1 hypothetical protein PV09_03351 [Verruconis gallopava]